MTYKELLHLVTFKEVEPHIVNMYPEAKDSLGWFKLHYDRDARKSVKNNLTI